mmetsp:Transcript_9443/g.22935  ORF Transcript_9443/g.22935 Transcript_9443/m.22935 type:complete len:285 (+) Transcript_9443:212-1066(+)
MDHYLKTSQERKDRWYARHIVPEYATVRSVTLDEIRRSAQHQLQHQHQHQLQPQLQPSKPNVPPHGAQRCGGAIVIGGMPSSLLFHKTHRHEARTYLHRHLEEHGFAVIQGVLDDSECNHALSLAWDYLEAASSAERKFRESFRTTRTDTGSDSMSIGTGEDTAGDPSPSLVVVRRGDRGTYRSPNFPRFVRRGPHLSVLWVRAFLVFVVPEIAPGSPERLCGDPRSAVFLFDRNSCTKTNRFGHVPRWDDPLDRCRCRCRWRRHRERKRKWRRWRRRRWRRRR